MTAVDRGAPQEITARKRLLLWARQPSSADAGVDADEHIQASAEGKDDDDGSDRGDGSDGASTTASDNDDEASTLASLDSTTPWQVRSLTPSSPPMPSRHPRGLIEATAPGSHPGGRGPGQATLAYVARLRDDVQRLRAMQKATVAEHADRLAFLDRERLADRDSAQEMVRVAQQVTLEV